MFNRSKKTKKTSGKNNANDRTARKIETEQETLELEQVELTLTQQVDGRDCEFDCQLDDLDLDVDLGAVDFEPNELEFETIEAEREVGLTDEAPLESENDANHPIVAVTEDELGNPPLDQSTKILENVEFLIALHEDSAESTSSPTQSLSEFDSAFLEAINAQTSEIESFFVAQNDSLSQHFDSKIDEGFAKVDSQLKQITSKVNQSLKSAKNKKNSTPSTTDSELVETIETQQGKLDELIEFVTVHFDERTNEIVKSFQSDEQPTVDLGSFKDDLDDRFHALDQRLQKIASAIEGQQQLIEAQTHRSSERESSAKVANSSMANSTAPVNSISTTDQSLADDESHWSRQKAAMLSKYGIDPEHRPSMAIPLPEPDIEIDPAIVAIPDEELHDLHDLQNSINEMSAEDTEHIDQLKEDLTSKLRDAEVELSIQRAKLSQMNAALDEKKTELDRRQSQLEVRCEEFARTSAASGPSLLERLKRHLNAKDRKNLDRL